MNFLARIWPFGKSDSSSSGQSSDNQSSNGPGSASFPTISQTVAHPWGAVPGSEPKTNFSTGRYEDLTMPENPPERLYPVIEPDDAEPQPQARPRDSPIEIRPDGSRPNAIFAFPDLPRAFESKESKQSGDPKDAADQGGGKKKKRKRSDGVSATGESLLTPGKRKRPRMGEPGSDTAPSGAASGSAGFDDNASEDNSAAAGVAKKQRLAGGTAQATSSGAESSSDFFRSPPPKRMRTGQSACCWSVC